MGCSAAGKIKEQPTCWTDISKAREMRHTSVDMDEKPLKWLSSRKLALSQQDVSLAQGQNQVSKKSLVL
jgi:hypothetical protein